MASRNDVELARSVALHYQDKVALLRSRLYRWGMAATPHLEQLERELGRAEQRLSEVRDSPPCPATTNAGRRALATHPPVSCVNKRRGQES